MARLLPVLGWDAIVPDDRLPEYAVDGIIPRAAVRPADRDGVVQTLAWASARASSEKITVFPRGGGTQSSLGNVPAGVDLVLDLGGLDKVLDFQPEDLTATVGGILAANTSGPRRFTYGLPRDWLIGISVISADGTETKAGGKVVKNVTGYDLNRLYTGSLGTLGVIAEATFKLAPLPAHRQALSASFDSIAAALGAGRGLLNQPYSPQGVQVLNGLAAQRLDDAADPPAMAIAFFEGPGERLVERRVSECSRILDESGASDVTSFAGDRYSPLLSRLTDLGWAPETIPYLAVKVTLPASRVADMTAESMGEPPAGVVADLGFGTIRLYWWPGSDSGLAGAMDGPAALAAIKRVRDLAARFGGNAVVEYCPPALKEDLDVWGEPPQSVDIMRRIKERFDPSGILNPGRFAGGI